MPEEISWSGNVPRGRMIMLDGNRRLNYSAGKTGVTKVKLPKDIKLGPFAIKFTKK